MMNASVTPSHSMIMTQTRSHLSRSRPRCRVPFVEQLKSRLRPLHGRSTSSKTCRRIYLPTSTSSSTFMQRSWSVRSGDLSEPTIHR
jgi:hypothetical protein